MNCCSRGAPIFVYFQACRTGLKLLDQRLRTVRCSLSEEAEIEGKCFSGLKHMAKKHCSGGSDRDCSSAKSASKKRGNAARQCLFALTWIDEMDVTVNSASRDDQSFGSADVRIGSDYKLGMHPVHDAGIACLTDTQMCIRDRRTTGQGHGR